MDYTNLPNILNSASIDRERPRNLKVLSELLQIAYQLCEHPIFKNWKDYEDIDPFSDYMDKPEEYKYFNRTIIERTIAQSLFFGRFEFDDGIMTMTSKGIEYTIELLKSFFEKANKLVQSTDIEISNFGSNVLYFRLEQSGVLVASVKYFLETCNELIMITQQHFIKKSLNKIEKADEKIKFLLRQKADLQQQKDQLNEKVFEGVLNTIQIELNYHEEINDHFELSFEVKEIIKQFLSEKRARVSNQKLLLLLIEERLDEFNDALSDLVLQLFSYHDIGYNETEKIYHAFLLGVFNDFKHQFDLKSNREAGIGRFDILLIPNTLDSKGVIIEVKKLSTNSKTVVDNTLEEGLQQIIKNKYYVELKGIGHLQFIAIAAAFFGKELFLKSRLHNI